MNLFYKETREKLQNYSDQREGEKFQLFRFDAKYDEPISHYPAKIFRFSVLISDLVALNLILIVLLQVLNLVKDNPNGALLITANISWIVSSYTNALYFSNEKFLKRSIQSFLLYFALTLLLIFLFKRDFSRGFVLLNFICFGISLIVTRVMFIGTQYYYAKNTVFSKKVIVLGFNELSHRLISSLKTQNNAFMMKGFFDDCAPLYKHSSAYPILGAINESLDYAIKNGVSEIYSTIPPENNPRIYEIAQLAEENFIRFRFVPDFSIFINRSVHISFVQDLPILSFRQEPLQDIVNRVKKRIFDIVFSSLVILFVLSWLIPILAILIKLDSKGPVFFKQLRSGKNNQPFLCFKFRSLTINPDSDLKQVSRNDNRLTRVGEFLRKTNLDELPQFFNVFQGYMSVVGPRPHMLKHTQQYSEVINQYMVRHYVKPGVTGLAQTHGYRGEITKKEDLDKRIEYDIKYMENWSMSLDIRIIFLTIYKTFQGDENAF
jgi:putative colanic acid biosynthesis UDP-glucose lipid carrier transferase